MCFALVMTWLVVGAASAVFWITNRHDLEVGDLPFVIITSIAGPFNFLVGWAVCSGDDDESTVLIKKRSKK